MTPRVANAPLSYGAFEMTVGTDFAVPEPERILEAIGAAGYEGTDLGPPGYLGEGDVLRERLAHNGLEVVGGFVPMRFSEAEGFEEDVAALHHTLDLFDAAGATGARPVLCDAGGPERIANPGRGGEEPALRLDDARWRGWSAASRRAADIARERGYEPVFHHHTSTYVEGMPGDRALPRGHRRGAAARLRPPARRRRRPGAGARRLGRPHRRRPRQGRAARTCSRTVKAERADTLTAWRRGLFCALGQGDVDLDGFCAALASAATTAGSSSSRTACSTTSPPSRAPRTSRSPTASGCGSTPDGEPRRPHHGPDQRRRLPAAGRRLAARGRVVRQVPRRQLDQRRGRRRPLRPPRGDDHPHRRGPVRRVPPRRAPGLRRRRPLRHRRSPASRRRSRSARSSRPTTSRSTSTAACPRRRTWRSAPTSSTTTRSAPRAVFWVTVTGLSDEPSRERHARRARGARRSPASPCSTSTTGRCSGSRARAPASGSAARSSTSTVAVGNLDETDTAVGEREPRAAAQALRDARRRAGGRQAGPEGRARRRRATSWSRCRRCRSRSSTASAPATRSAARCATGC